MKNTIVNNLTDYIHFIKGINEEKNNKKFLFYRGLSSVDYKLIPKVFREPFPERDVILDYKQYLPQFNPCHEFPKDILKILTDMQHYRIPTRLLDWTTSPLIALYFACTYEKEKEGETDSKICILDPWKLFPLIIPKEDRNKYLEIHQIHITARTLLSLYDIAHEKKGEANREQISNILLNDYGYKTNDDFSPFEKPYSFVSSFSNDRIVRQKGVFTIHGTNKSALEGQIDLENTITITKEKKQEILAELDLFGIDDYSVFPDFEGMKKVFDRKKSLFDLL